MDTQGLININQNFRCLIFEVEMIKSDKWKKEENHFTKHGGQD